MGQRLPGNLFGVLCVLFCSLATQAQLVFIPDTNLREYLAAWAPGAVDGDGFLDPQHPSVLAHSWLSVEAEMDWDPVDLTGLEALDQLDSLYVNFVWQEGGMTLASFDTVQVSANAWPPNLTKMNLLCGTYASLPAWPSSLTHLDYYLPSGPSALPPLPASLTHISFTAGEDLTSLPDLPEGLTTVTLNAPEDNVVPALPMTITSLAIHGFSPAGVSAWPSSMTSVSLTSIDEWTSLPAWPAGLLDIDVDGADGLAALPAWPSSLTDLDLSNCVALVDLPAFPSGLLDLALTGLPALAALPDYPASLEELSIGGLGVVTLPEWPVGLDIEMGPMPNLVSMPDFSPTTRWIRISGGLPQLAALPAWPDSLHELTIYSTSFNELPPFPAHLTSLALADMPNLHCLPLLPESLLGFFKMAGDCLPNIPPGLSSLEVGPDMFVPVTTSMLCTVLNSTCDFLNPVATGTVYWDQNANGVREGGEPGYPFSSVNAQPGNITYGVPSTGDYVLPLPFDQYTLAASSNNPYVQSISPATHDAFFVTTTDVDTGNDFGVVLQPNVQDVRIDLNGPFGRPGFENTGNITYDNIGSLVVDGTVTLQLDADQIWVGAQPAPTSVTGNTIIWDFSGLQVGERRTIGFTVATDEAMPLGTELVHTATIDPVASDATPADNTATSTTTVEGSWDPNNKRVEPATLTPVEVMAGEEVIYTIRFQNTGTYQADRVIITDELSGDLQWNTMRLINSSHPCTWVISGDGLLRFTLEPIFLPDSTNDEPNSHGYVRFAMKPVSDLMLGESVSNTADIHFDFNEPVVTNEAVFTVDASTGVTSTAERAQELRIWPNPATEMLYVEGAAAKTIEVLDVTGRVVLRERSTHALQGLDVGSLARGGYTVRVIGAGSRAFIKR
jgi:uncharacterized repeat protein (TIGR01451 family)